MRESHLISKINNYLKEASKTKEIVWERRQAGGYNYKIGRADYWFVCDGKHYEIEVKREEEKIILKSDQIKWLKKCEKNNIDCIISND